MLKNLLRNREMDKAYTLHNVDDISLYINCVFHSGRNRTPVAMATNSSHRFIMGKVEIDHFCCFIEDI